MASNASKAAMRAHAPAKGATGAAVAFVLVVGGVVALGAIAYFLFFGAGASRINQAATASDVKALLIATTQPGSLAAFASETMQGQLRGAPGLDPRAPGIVAQEVNQFFKAGLEGSLGDRLVPVFAQRFTAGEMKEIATFYQSPVGKKMGAQMPLIATDSAAIAQQWMLDQWPSLSQQVEAGLKQAGVALPTRAAPQAAPLPGGGKP